ncbi:PXMP2/4 family protein 4 [Pistacia vera]|uniref:PXMP2/4 family protein 4 n=1 Tax=Pistacia vera TaxID=55513 RepID=UPI0012636136|nr:PXMP2/4 family protein 4 [Pistacia vera]XP_031270697.1 PXMP2/4 family protein 4 [Pistacia vera]XP_031270698.1 PXMP2/4 family protein 4 [Pistacia vera]
MGSKCKSIKHLSDRCLHRRSEKQPLLDVNFYIEHFVTNQQWRSNYSRFPQRLSKIRDVKVYPSSNFPSHSLPFSTLQKYSTESKIGFLGWYLGKLESYPLITKSITSSLIYAAADLTSQIITSPSFSSIDSIRTLRMAAYGMLILGPSQHFWFNYMSKILPKRDTLTTLKKLFMGQAVYGPSITAVFFSYNASLQGESGGEITARLKRDLLPTLATGLLYWPICDFITYKFVPVHLQPLVNSSCAYIWTIYLTYMASLKKVSSD